MLQSADEAIPPHAIQDALARVLASREFRGATRKCRFLQFVVQQTLEGHAHCIKAYTIGLDVFDRDTTFDPLIDPVVRIQAGRIRRSLEKYYLTEGANDPIRIAIPKGSYVPLFQVRDRIAPADHLSAVDQDDLSSLPSTFAEPPTDIPASASPPLPLSFRQRIMGVLTSPKVMTVAVLLGIMVALLAITGWNAVSGPRSPLPETPLAAARGPSLLVQPLANGTDNPARDIFVEGFTEDLIAALIRFRNLLVFGSGTSFRYRTASELQEANPTVTVDYVLQGSVTQAGEQVQITVVLMKAKSRQYLWSASYRRDFTPATMITLRQDIAVQIARALAQPHGVIYTEEARNTDARPTKELSAYECMLRTRQYWRQLNADLHGQVRTCLERATRTDPSYADAWAARAMVTIDEARLGFNPTPARPDPVAVGLQLAMHAVELDPNNPLPLQALGLAYWLRQEPTLSIAAYEKALALNPNDSDILADLGRCYSLIGEWDKGVPMIREAFARNPAQPSWYHIVIALFHYVHKRYDNALVEARQVGVPESVLPHIALAMIHGQTGNKADAAQEVDNILRIDPEFGAKAMSELARRNIAPGTIASIVEGLQKAGLPVARTPSAQGF
ncbi:tetratricopeptide repeat protein [Azospirillum canadense]|uniref:tetratricopeptide repeat protein n=1 Tax=Azospirillum canadense TaxID=403962 RepID=UPI00222794AC|nr:tetratricopeptide repeat protein [Azospirillum canadense]MCW2241542.1 TolB-like protein/Tfp pilus assembly protein PilF [Azospirillum canadense]